MRSLLFGLVLLPLVAGCGGQKKTKISGQVRFNGAPLPGGLVTFQTNDPKYGTIAATLDEQGNFEATLPVGEVKAAVDNRSLQPPTAARAGLPPGLPAGAKQILSQAKAPQGASSVTSPSKPPGTYVPIPEKYYTVERSGLALTVERGRSKYDIELSK